MSDDDFSLKPYLGSPLAGEGDTIISFPHYQPRLELSPEKRFLIEPNLAKVIGSDPLETQIRRLGSHIHLFGHTHIPIDMKLDGVQYIQWPLGYFRESDKQCAPIFNSGPLLFYDTDLGSGVDGLVKSRPSLDTWWSKYYQMNARNPDDVVNLAPWVLNRLASFSGLVYTNQKREQEANNADR